MELENVPGALKLNLPSLRKAAEQVQEAMTKQLGPAVQEAARSIQAFPATHKAAVAEKHQEEELMYSLFGGPPRNRHEWRKWAALMRKRGVK